MTSRAEAPAVQVKGSAADAALDLAGRGWLVFPCRGKTPLTENGFRDATDDPQSVREFWQRWPEANIGLALPKGVMVLDVDSEDALAELDHEHLDLPATLTVKTSRGYHFYYATSEPVRQTAGAIMVGVDTRVGGYGYVIVPPSVHLNGTV